MMHSAQTCQAHLTARATLGSKVTRTQTAQVNNDESVNFKTFVCLSANWMMERLPEGDTNMAYWKKEKRMEA